VKRFLQPQLLVEDFWDGAFIGYCTPLTEARMGRETLPVSWVNARPVAKIEWYGISALGFGGIRRQVFLTGRLLSGGMDPGKDVAVTSGTVPWQQANPRVRAWLVNPCSLLTNKLWTGNLGIPRRIPAFVQLLAQKLHPP